MTSESARRSGSWDSLGMVGVDTRVPSARSTRTSSPCPPSTGRPLRSVEPYHPPFSHDVLIPFAQLRQVLSPQVNGVTTKSPTATVDTESPAASTTPTNSCPIRSPGVNPLSPR